MIYSKQRPGIQTVVLEEGVCGSTAEAYTVRVQEGYAWIFGNLQLAKTGCVCFCVWIYSKHRQWHGQRG